MDDRKIEVLLSVVEYGSFSKASEHLQCTQSAVTQTINRLEDELDCKLLLRYHSGIKLTERGLALLPDFQAAHQALSQLSQHARTLATQEKTIIRIGTFSSIANTWLPNLLLAYNKKHPEVKLDIHISTDDLKEQLEAQKIDIAFGDSLRLTGMQFTKLIDDPFYAVIPSVYNVEGDTITQKQLATLPFLMAPLNALDQVLTVQPQNSVDVNCDDDSTLLHMVERGLGATVMPELSLKAATIKNKAVQILDVTPPLHRSIGFGYLSATTATEQFAAFTQKWVTENL